MERYEKHRVTLLNAKCNYVCIAEEALKKSQYGEDVSCCIKNLWLAFKLINKLDCYCFDSKPLGEEEIGAVFEFTITNSSYTDGWFIGLSIDGELVETYTVSGTLNSVVAISNMLTASGYEFDLVDNDPEFTFVVTVGCESMKSLIITQKPDDAPITYSGELTTQGVCTVSECNNCIEQLDLYKMYSVLDNLLS